MLQDTYMIGNNVTFSSVWGTPCTPTLGDCGSAFFLFLSRLICLDFFVRMVCERCDNCQGHFTDISNRMDQFYQRLFDRGWTRTKSVWAVPQAFGNERSVEFSFLFFFTLLLYFLIKLLDGEKFFFFSSLSRPITNLPIRVCCRGFQQVKNFWYRVSSASTTVPKVKKK